MNIRRRTLLVMSIHDLLIVRKTGLHDHFTPNEFVLVRVHFLQTHILIARHHIPFIKALEHIIHPPNLDAFQGQFLICQLVDHLEDYLHRRNSLQTPQRSQLFRLLSMNFRK